MELKSLLYSSGVWSILQKKKKKKAILMFQVTHSGV